MRACSGRKELIPHVTTGCGGQGISVVHVEALAPFRPPGQLVCADPDDQELCAGIWQVAALARNGEARSMTTGATPPQPPLRGAADVALASQAASDALPPLDARSPLNAPLPRRNERTRSQPSLCLLSLKLLGSIRAGAVPLEIQRPPLPDHRGADVAPATVHVATVRPYRSRSTSVQVSSRPSTRASRARAESSPQRHGRPTRWQI